MLKRSLFFGALLVGALGVVSTLFTSPAAAATNPQMNFQGRLLNAQGAVVADGYYNIQFKIYEGGTGTAAGNPTGTLKWTENWLNSSSQGVQVINGYMSVQLGSINPFGSQVDWNSDTLWLSMNIGNTNTTCTPYASCSPDGEMLPMKRLSAVAYAMNATMLNGKTATDFIQNTTTVQTGNIAIQSSGAANIGAVIQGAGGQTADIFQVKADGVTTPILSVTGSGTVFMQSTDDANALTLKTSMGNNMLTVDAANSRVGIGLGGSVQPAISGAGVEIKGALRLSGGGNTYADTYLTPVGSSVGTKINIPYYDPGNYGQILAMGLPASASSTARVISLFDARASSHQPTLGVFSPDENNVFGLSWDGSNTTPLVKSSTDSVALNANNTNVLTARNNGGQAAVGIGNTGLSGYSLDVTGDINSSTQYRIGGTTTLTDTSLTFSGTSLNTVQGSSGQSLILQAGNAAALNTNGSNLYLNGGTGNGTGAQGLVVISTPTFSTTTADANCFTGGNPVTASCTISQNSVNNTAAIVVGFTVDGQTSTLPDPTVLTAGRVVYVTASTTSKDFTLSVNGGGQGNQIAMRKNTTATMIWNGADWTAAGASSSTTLQAAYDNTLQSAGGAELVVSKTSATNGLTIRDSSTNSVNGTLLSVQTSSAAGLLQVNSNVTEYATDAGAEVAGATSTTFPASTWTALTGTTVTRYTTAGSYIATGQGSVSAVTNATANTGIKNQLSSALTANMTYNVSFTTRLLGGTFTDMNIYYSIDGSAASVPCSLSATSVTSTWTKVNCAFKAPASGITAGNAILIRQTTATVRTFYVDNLSVTIAADFNLATDGGVDDTTNFGTNWSAVSGSSVSQNLSVGNDTSSSAQAITAATAGQGIRNKLSMNPLPSTLYRISIYAASSNTFNDFLVRYSRDGGANFVNCADYNTQIVSTSLTSFTKITCYITTDGTAATNPYVYFTQTSGTARTFYVDTFSMTLNSNTTPNVQVGGGVNGGPTTLFTLDKGASAPIAANNDALLGSMYYDTTLGKLQCYEADGWGACGSSPDNIITISPEYTNAVLHGTGIGTMTSDLCSDYLNINDGTSGQPIICGSSETYNFYKWTSPQASTQTYSIYVTYQLPSTFKSFNSGQTSLMARTDNGSNGGSATVQYSILKNAPSSGTTPCGGTIPVSSGTQVSWLTQPATGAADPSTCGFAPGNSIVFKIDVIANRNANAYVGNLNFSFSNR